MSKKIAVIHTSLAIREPMDKKILELIPDAEIHNIIDERILQDVMDNKGINTSVIKRMSLYTQAAEAMGADVVLNACSSVGEAFDVGKELVEIPTVKIDEPMAEIAVESGKNIGVYGTVATTLAPSCRLIEKTAKNAGKDVKITSHLVDGAFQVLSQEKNPEKHNEMVLKEINATHQEHDVIVLAQASMSILIPHLQHLGKPVLYSLHTGIERVKQVLECSV